MRITSKSYTVEIELLKLTLSFGGFIISVSTISIGIYISYGDALDSGIICYMMNILHCSIYDAGLRDVPKEDMNVPGNKC